jgi:hypothetical protein
MIVLIFFAVIGLCSFITALIDSAHGSAGKNIVMTVRHPSANEAEATLRQAARICMRSKGARLICICDSDEPSYPICELMQRDYPFIELMNDRAFANIMNI